MHWTELASPAHARACLGLHLQRQDCSCPLLCPYCPSETIDMLSERVTNSSSTLARLREHACAHACTHVQCDMRPRLHTRAQVRRDAAGLHMGWGDDHIVLKFVYRGAADRILRDGRSSAYACTHARMHARTHARMRTHAHMHARIV